MTKLDNLLEKIEGLLADAELACNNTLNSFRPDTAIKTPEDLKRILADFHCKSQNHYLNFEREVDLNHDFGMVGKALTEMYGPGGFKRAFHMTISGESEGLYGVLKNLTAHFSYGWTRTRIQALVGQYYNSLPMADDKINAGKEYFEKYKHLLPSEFVDENGIRVIAYHWKALEIHPLIIARTKKIRG